MPELPEVEIVSRNLQRLVSGRRIEAARLLRERLSPFATADEFSASLAGAGINFVHRRGKHILFDLDTGRTLMTHLRMSGRFMLLQPDRDDPKFTHAVFHLDDGSRLVFQDQRHFGMMRILESTGLAAARELASLAPEPFSDAFTAEFLYGTLRRSSRPVKEFLLDQTRVCGLGNIYAAEVLFAAGLHPAKRANAISRKRAALIHEKIREILTAAIEAGSTLNVDPEALDASYYSGGYAASWGVYDREGEPCHSCGTAIARLRQAGRSTYYCRRCQKR